MRRLFLFLTASMMVGAASGAAYADNAGRIYGKITTYRGDELVGFIRWDKNEASWVDQLDGTKERDRHRRNYEHSGRKKYSRRNNSIELFGMRLSGKNIDLTYASESGIRFGHLKSLEVDGDDAALLVTKSGIEFELTGGSGDIGTDNREIVIEDEKEGEMELVWDDIETIEFMQGPADKKSSFGKRLYGTLTTRRGDQFTGFVTWDMDEVFEDDVLDGEEHGRSRKIKFGQIATIERYSSNGANVILKDGNDMVLRGSNDVDDSNRGIVISDPGFGQVTVQWDEFDKLVFEETRKSVKYDDFDGGHELSGTVTTEGGDQYTGKIRWDDDEEYTWEMLDGEDRDVDFEIELGLVKSIEKRSRRGSVVTVKDGREFRLRGSNDVDDDNRGIIITDDKGEETYVDWEDFGKVEFN